MIANGLHSGLAGMATGINGLNRNAAEIASSQQMDGTAPRDISDPLVEQSQNLRQVEASSKVVSAADGMIGTLIDAFA